jgi:hypothetical protein
VGPDDGFMRLVAAIVADDAAAVSALMQAMPALVHAHAEVAARPGGAAVAHRRRRFNKR